MTQICLFRMEDKQGAESHNQPPEDSLSPRLISMFDEQQFLQDLKGMTQIRFCRILYESRIRLCRTLDEYISPNSNQPPEELLRPG